MMWLLNLQSPVGGLAGVCLQPQGILLLALLGMLGMSPAWGAEQQIDTQRAMRSMANTSWYDDESQGYAPPRVSQERDNPQRHSNWIAKPVTTNRTPWNLGLAPFAEVFSWIMLGLLAIGLVAAVGFLIAHMLRTYHPRPVEPGSSRKIAIDQTRVTELPFEVARAQHDPLSEAKRLAAQGSYNQAIIYLYGYMLLALDHARHIHLQKGKTNRMYLGELKRTGLKRIVEPSMLAFEDVYFGKHSLSQEHFQLLWSQLDEFHRLLGPEEKAAASPSSQRVLPA